MKQKSFQAYGFDGNPYAQQVTSGLAQTLNLAQWQNLNRKFDWVQSFGVGEHIPANDTDVFVENLMKHAEKGILISWAIKN